MSRELLLEEEAVRAKHPMYKEALAAVTPTSDQFEGDMSLSIRAIMTASWLAGYDFARAKIAQP
jgi:hypothetical protein